VEARLRPQRHREAWSAGGGRRAIGGVGRDQSTREALRADTSEFTLGLNEVYPPECVEE
jgi:hypothetical protein